MTLDLLAISVFTTAALLYAVFVPGRGRGWALLVASVVAIYWLQPPLPPRFASYALQTATVALTVMTWWLTRPRDAGLRQATWREDRVTLLLIFLLVVAMALNRFVAAAFRLTADRPPTPLLVIGILSGAGALFAALLRLTRTVPRRTLLGGAILFFVLLFIVLKTGPLATAVAAGWRTLSAQDVTLAAPVDLAWLGFSYVAFRLIHTLRDRQTGILPALSLREYVTYVIFFPSYVAGPIDRAERFVADLRHLPQMPALAAPRFLAGGARIFLGLFKKFVLADSLALLSLNAVNAEQATSTAALWLLLYGYALRLYLDFSGYSDIAIGIGNLLGFELPENFRWPYLRTNITQFWQSWHITLSDWVRFYVFSPLSRALLRRRPRPSPTLIVLVAQLATMIVIGLWHGVTWPFFIWGVWHGVGLFVHKQWSDRTRRWYRNLQQRPWPQRWAWILFAWFITFHFVVLGWVWFVLPTPALAVQTLARLFGLGW